MTGWVAVGFEGVEVVFVFGVVGDFDVEVDLDELEVTVPVAGVVVEAAGVVSFVGVAVPAAAAALASFFAFLSSLLFFFFES